MFSYFTLGIHHVLDLQAYDHLLFVCIMLVNQTFDDWKKVLGLITAFTLGHSLTLAISIIYKPILPSEWVEFAIPITILLTAILSLLNKQKSEVRERSIYVLVLLFGFIHGMGFANYLKFMLPTDENFGLILLSFNLGIEVAQIIAATIILSIMTILSFTSKSTVQTAQKLISVVTILISLFLASQNFPF